MSRARITRSFSVSARQSRRVGAGADEPLLEERDERASLGVLQAALVALEQRDGRRWSGTLVAPASSGSSCVERLCPLVVCAGTRWSSGSSVDPRVAVGVGQRHRGHREGPLGAVGADGAEALERRPRPASSRSAARWSSPKISTGRRSEGSSESNTSPREAAGSSERSASSSRSRSTVMDGPPWAISSAANDGGASAGPAVSASRVGRDVVGRVVEPLPQVVDVDPGGQQRQRRRSPAARRWPARSSARTRSGAGSAPARGRGRRRGRRCSP